MTLPPFLDFNFNALINYLAERGLAPEYQNETGQVYVTLSLQGHDVPVFFLIRSESQLLQIVAYLPYPILPDSFGETARLLHLLNKELDVPGFGMDEAEGLMFYRAVIPAPENKLDRHLFDLYLGVLRIACDTFMNAIGTVASGQKTMKDIRKK